jgi:accessory gene regulator B
MFAKISCKITDNLIRSGTISYDEKEVYLFGIQQGLVILLNILTTIFIGILFDVVWQLLLFTVSYIGLRSFAGGYHAKTPQRCYILSTILTFAIALLQKYVILTFPAYVVLLCISTSIILTISPIDSKEKTLDELEKRVYHKKAIIICLTEFCTALLLGGLSLYSIGSCIVWTLSSVSFMMVLAVLLRILRKETAYLPE